MIPAFIFADGVNPSAVKITEGVVSIVLTGHQGGVSFSMTVAAAKALSDVLDGVIADYEGVPHRRGL